MTVSLTHPITSMPLKTDSCCILIMRDSSVRFFLKLYPLMQSRFGGTLSSPDQFKVEHNSPWNSRKGMLQLDKSLSPWWILPNANNRKTKVSNNTPIHSGKYMEILEIPSLQKPIELSKMDSKHHETLLYYAPWYMIALLISTL